VARQQGHGGGAPSCVPDRPIRRPV
jgi:hypothetical protein